MRWRGWIGLLLAAGCAASAFASFELVLVLDRGTRKVHRFDGVTGAYFGAFGSFSSHVRSIAIDQAANEVYVFDAQPAHGLLTRWNYNTGAMTGLVDGWNPAVRWIGPAQGSGRYIVSFSTQFERWRWPLNYEAVVHPGIGDPQSLVRHGSDYIAFGSTGFRQVSETFGLGAAVSLPGNLGAGTIAHSAFATFAVAGRSGTNGGTFAPVTPGWFGSAISWTAPALATVTGVGSSHNGFYAVGKNVDNTAQGRVTKMAMARSAVQMHSFGEGVLVDPVGVATVVAPEPGTLALLGGGLAALLVRRRRRGSG
jgi:hypothetical protein